MWRARTDKRYGLDFFFAREPADDAESDVPSEYWDTEAQARARAQKIIAAGRFKLVMLYVFQAGEWVLLDDWQAPEPIEEPKPSETCQPAKVSVSASPKVSKDSTEGKRVAVKQKVSKRRKVKADAISTRKSKARKRNR